MTSDYTTKLQSSIHYGTGEKKNRNVHQWNKIDSPEMNPCTHGYVIFKLCWENWTAMCKRMKLEHFLTPYRKINSIEIIDINITPETKILRGKHRQNT